MYYIRRCVLCSEADAELKSQIQACMGEKLDNSDNCTEAATNGGRALAMELVGKLLDAIIIYDPPFIRQPTYAGQTAASPLCISDIPATLPAGSRGNLTLSVNPVLKLIIHIIFLMRKSLDQKFNPLI